MGISIGLRPGELLIDDENFHEVKDQLFRFRPDGVTRGRGHDPNQIHPGIRQMMSPPSEMPLLPETDWKGFLEQLTAEGALLSDVRNRIDGGKPKPALDQGPVGYCWAHSITHTIEMARGVANMPYVPLSAYSIAATIKKGADEGGWCGLSALFARTKGVMSQRVWPQGDRNYRQYDKPENWAEALTHMITEDWVDLSRDVYDQQLTFNQLVSCLLSGIACAVDFNWWSHSVCALDLVLVEAGSWGIRILNSWGNGWSENGTGVLRGSKARPDSAVATRRVRPSVASIGNPNQIEVAQAV